MLLRKVHTCTQFFPSNIISSLNNKRAIRSKDLVISSFLLPIFHSFLLFLLSVFISSSLLFSFLPSFLPPFIHSLIHSYLSSLRAYEILRALHCIICLVLIFQIGDELHYLTKRQLLRYFHNVEDDIFQSREICHRL